ncbi:unnamed protein product [Pedinophyceae sp. YPF-701]|nr:unnamed protein product [Pedinophyceae sp. YPF-701]
MEYVSPEGLRVDGRRPKELRRIQCEVGVLPYADGSASFAMGNTRAIAAVYGPRPLEAGVAESPDGCTVRCEFTTASFATSERRKRRKGDRRSAECAALVRCAVENSVVRSLLKRSLVDVHVLIEQADGGTRSCAINAAIAAVIDAGIPCVDVAGAVAAGYLDGTALLDLNYVEDGGNGPDVVVALQPREGRVVVLESDGRTAVDTLTPVIALAVEGCRAVAEQTRAALAKAAAQRAALAVTAPKPPGA